VGSIQVFFDIQEQGTGRYIIKNASSTLVNIATNTRDRVSEAHPAFVIGAWIIAHQIGGGAHIVNYGKPSTSIEEGHYKALVLIIRAGDSIEREFLFDVGKQSHETFWT